MILFRLEIEEIPKSFPNSVSIKIILKAYQLSTSGTEIFSGEYLNEFCRRVSKFLRPPKPKPNLKFLRLRPNLSAFSIPLKGAESSPLNHVKTSKDKHHNTLLLMHLSANLIIKHHGNTISLVFGEYRSY